MQLKERGKEYHPNYKFLLNYSHHYSTLMFSCHMPMSLVMCNTHMHGTIHNHPYVTCITIVSMEFQAITCTMVLHAIRNVVIPLKSQEYNPCSYFSQPLYLVSYSLNICMCSNKAIHQRKVIDGNYCATV